MKGNHITVRESPARIAVGNIINVTLTHHPYEGETVKARVVHINDGKGRISIVLVGRVDP